MNILDLVSACGDKGLANIIKIAKTVLLIIQICGPILAIIGLVTVLFKLMSNPDNKKLKSAIKNWLIALVMLFFIPIIVNVVMGILDDSFSVTACWNYADEIGSSSDASFLPPSGEGSQSIIDDPSKYEGNEESKSKDKEKEDSSAAQAGASISKYIFIGDSRTVGMKNATGSNDIWSAKESVGLSWMQSTGVAQIESYVGSGSAVIILMGVNDLYKSDSYVSYINSKASEWTGKGAKVYFVSVLPTDGSYNSLNSEITSFNSKMKSNLKSVKYIDTNSYLKETGFTTVDGLHYDNATYQKIYNHIKSNL